MIRCLLLWLTAHSGHLRPPRPVTIFLLQFEMHSSVRDQHSKGWREGSETTGVSLGREREERGGVSPSCELQNCVSAWLCERICRQRGRTSAKLHFLFIVLTEACWEITPPLPEPEGGPLQPVQFNLSVFWCHTFTLVFILVTSIASFWHTNQVS